MIDRYYNGNKLVVVGLIIASDAGDAISDDDKGIIVGAYGIATYVVKAIILKSTIIDSSE